MALLSELGLDTLGAAVGLVTVLLVEQRLGVLPFAESLGLIVRKSLRVMTSPRISEHWKERVMPRYALRLFLGSLRLTVSLILLVIVFAAGFVLVWLPVGGWEEALARLMGWQAQLIACTLGVGYLVLHRRNPTRSEARYGWLERLLHRVALSPPVRRAAFDVDCLMQRDSGPPIERPVYITGLARAGTTVLLEALYSTGDFVSLTYRDMPFVTAPGLWSRLSASHRRSERTHERAHGDGMEVGPDSPEAFEEVFWLTMLDADYVRENGLVPHTADAETIGQYRRYVGSILTASSDAGAAKRYLCKDNNHTLRIGTLKAAFADALILVPFRDPLAHARSLLRQHRRFIEIHARDAFSLSYMRWLGHFEFGAELKPFLLDQDACPTSGEEALSLTYWVRYWGIVYAEILARHRSDVLFFDYDGFIREPGSSLERLAVAIDIDRSKLCAFVPEVHRESRERQETDSLPGALLDHVGRIHCELKAAAL